MVALCRLSKREIKPKKARAINPEYNRHCPALFLVFLMVSFTSLIPFSSGPLVLHRTTHFARKGPFFLMLFLQRLI